MYNDLHITRFHSAWFKPNLPSLWRRQSQPVPLTVPLEKASRQRKLNVHRVQMMAYDLKTVSASGWTCRTYLKHCYVIKQTRQRNHNDEVPSIFFFIFFFFLVCLYNTNQTYPLMARLQTCIVQGQITQGITTSSNHSVF